MSKKLLFILLLFFSFNHTQAQYIYYNKRIPVTPYNDVCRGIVALNNGYLVAGGHVDENNYAYLYVSKLDNVGNLKWTKDFCQPGYAYYFGLSGSLLKLDENSFLIGGTRVSTNANTILISTDSAGNIKWEKEYNLASFLTNGLSSLNLTNDSGYIITGKTRLDNEKYRYLLLKTDKLGIFEWFNTYTDNHPNRHYEGKSVIQTPDKGYCLGGNGGYHPTPNYYYIAEIIKTDSLGNQQWKKTYGNPLNCNWGTMLCLSQDSCIIATYSLAASSSINSNRQVYLTKIGLNGTEKWNKTIGLPSPNKWSSWIQILSDGGFIISGNNQGGSVKYLGWLFKLNKNGDSLWYREYSVINEPNDANELWQVTPTPDKGFAAAGSLYPNAGNQDIWVLKTDSMGCLVPNCHVGITEFNPNTGAQMLFYPNPFKESFAINYFIPAGNKEAVFQLYDIYGKLVYQIGLTREVMQLQVVAESLSPGVYIACLLVDNIIVQTEKIIKN